MRKLILLFLFIILIYTSFSLKRNESFYNYESKPTIAIQTVFILKENLPFLEEWIVYHKKIGVDKFYLYDNTGSKYKKNGDYLNKRLMDYNKIIKLNDREVEIEMNKLKKKYPEIVLVKWQPRDNNNNITYGQLDAIKHYIKNYGNECDYTAFTDTDEFIYVTNEDSLKDYIKEKKTDKFVIQQTKMNDRFCGSIKNNSILDITSTLDIKSQWAPKNIINNSAININNIKSIHNIPIKTNNSYKCNKSELYFFHFNISNTETQWIKTHYKKETLNKINNNTLNNFSKKNNIYSESKFLNKNYIKDNKTKLCYMY